MIDKKSINTKSSLEQKYLKNCEEICSKIDQLIPYKKTLCVIANYIDYMCCNQYIQDYERKFLENAFNVLLTIFQEYFNKTYTDLINCQEIGDYINSIYAIIQSNWYSDFRAIQMVDFSVVPYYSPVKIRYFYTYLVDQFSAYYKFLGEEDKKSYSFVIIPQNFGKVCVEQLFKEEYTNEKLMFIYS